MKIAFVCGEIAAGGTERVVANLCNSFSETNNYEVYLVTAERQEGEYWLSSLVHREILLRNHLLPDVKKLRDFLKKNDIDIAIGMGIYPNFVMCMAKENNARTKMIISERNDPEHDRLSSKSKLLRFMIYRKADGYVFQIEGAKTFYSKSIQRRGVIIPNPVKDNLPSRSKVHNKEIVAVGRMAIQKNQSVLVKAFSLVYKEHPEYKLRIFGRGSQLELLQKLVKELGIEDSVLFEGFCNDVHNAIKDSDIFVMSSDYEGMPNALMEAMAMGFPCVSTDCPCGGPRQLIDRGINGYLSEVGNPEDMAEKITFLIENPLKKEEIAEKASKIREEYSSTVIQKMWTDYFECLMKNH